MGDIDTYFSIVALFILFRETVEASIIVSVLLQFLSRSFPHLRKQVWWGVAAGIALSIVFGVIFSLVFYVAKNNIFSGNNKSIFKGTIAWFAAILITILAFAMLRYKGWEDKIKRKLETLAREELERQERGDVEDPVPATWIGRAKQNTGKSLKKCTRPVGLCCLATTTFIGDAVAKCWSATTGICRRNKSSGQKSDLAGVGDHANLATSSSHGVGIFLIVFTTVLREGVESIIFLAGVGNAQPSSLPLPGLVGFICGCAVGVFLYYTGKQVKDIKWFLIIMSLVLFFIAAGQIMLGVNFLTIGGMFGEASIWLNERPWYMQPVWDLSGCCAINDENKNKGWVLAAAIFGYQDKPSVLQIIFYFSHIVICIAIAIIKYFRGSLFDADYKYKRQMAKEAKLASMELTSLEQAEQEQLKLAGAEDKLPGYAARDTDSNSANSHSPPHSQRGASKETAPSAPPADTYMLPPGQQSVKH